MKRADSFGESRWLLVTTEAGEGRGILGVDGLDVLASTTSTAEVTTRTTLATALAAAAATATTTAATTSATGALRLDEARVEVNGLLGLLLTLAPVLARAGGEVVRLLLLEGLGLSPLLVGLGALVGSTGLEAGVKLKLLLGLLNEVVGVGDGLVLGLGVLFASGVLGESLLLLGLGNGLAGLLVLQLGLTLGGAPGSGGLLVGTARLVSTVARIMSVVRLTYP